MPGVLLEYSFGVRVRGGDLREPGILTLSPKSLRMCQSRVRTCVARVGHEADNCDMRNQESKFSFFLTPDVLITSPQITDQVTSRHLTHDDFQNLKIVSAVRIV
jgi:hypothetical protein